MQNFHVNIDNAVLGLINPIPTEFFLEHNGALGKLLPNLRFLAIIVS